MQLTEQKITRQQTKKLLGKLTLAQTVSIATSLERKEFDKAIKLCREIVETDPSAVFPHHFLGIALEGMGDFSAAVGEYSLASHLAPWFTAAHLQLGRVLRVLDQLEASVEEFLSALETSRMRSAMAWYELGCTLDQLGYPILARESWLHASVITETEPLCGPLLSDQIRHFRRELRRQAEDKIEAHPVYD